MKYLLDTNTCIQYMTGRSRSVTERLNALDEGEAVVCSVVKAELLFGALRSQHPMKTLASQRHFLSLFVSLPFDDAAAQYYGRLRADLTRTGTLIGSNDLFIAAIALANGLILVTHNTREFSRIAELKLDDWE